MRFIYTVIIFTFSLPAYILGVLFGAIEKSFKRGREVAARDKENGN